MAMQIIKFVHFLLLQTIINTANFAFARYAPNDIDKINVGISKTVQFSLDHLRDRSSKEWLVQCPEKTCNNNDLSIRVVWPATVSF